VGITQRHMLVRGTFMRSSAIVQTAFPESTYHTLSLTATDRPQTTII
jgi:hypothetical protein